MSHPTPGGRSSDREQSDADQLVTVDMMTRMLAASSALSVSASAMTDLVRADHELAKEERKEAKRARKRFMKGTIAAVVLILIVPTLNLVGLIQGNSQRHEIQRELQDCVLPTGQCFKDNQAQTKKAIDNVNQVTILAAACAPNYVRLPLPQRIAAIRKCVLAGEQAAAKAKARAKAQTKPTLPPPTTKPTLPRSAPSPGGTQSSGTLSRPQPGARQPGRATPPRAAPQPSASATAPRRAPAPRPSTARVPTAPPGILCTTLPVLGSICRLGR